MAHGPLSNTGKSSSSILLSAEQLVEDSSFAIDAATGVAELEFSLPASLVEQWAGKYTRYNPNTSLNSNSGAVGRQAHLI